MESSPPIEQQMEKIYAGARKLEQFARAKVTQRMAS
jgi:hypothetical protein